MWHIRVGGRRWKFKTGVESATEKSCVCGTPLRKKSVITYKYNVLVNKTTLILFTIKIVYDQGDMFRLLFDHLQAFLDLFSQGA